MINRWVLNIVVSFIMKQIEKFGRSIDWAKVKKDVDPIVRQAIPGTWFDQDAVDAVAGVIDAFALALRSTGDLQKIVELLAQERWNEAFLILKDLVLKVWNAKVGTKEAALAAELALMDAAHAA